MISNKNSLGKYYGKYYGNTKEIVSNYDRNSYLFAARPPALFLFADELVRVDAMQPAAFASPSCL